MYTACRLPNPAATTGTGRSAPPTQGTQPPQSGAQSAALQQLLAQSLQAQAGGDGSQGGLVNPAGIGAQQLQQAELLYQSELEQLSNMGFINRQDNLRGTVIGLRFRRGLYIYESRLKPVSRNVLHELTIV